MQKEYLQIEPQYGEDSVEFFVRAIICLILLQVGCGTQEILDHSRYNTDFAKISTEKCRVNFDFWQVGESIRIPNLHSYDYSVHP